jgi:hypothetical protein
LGALTLQADFPLLYTLQVVYRKEGFRWRGNLLLPRGTYLKPKIQNHPKGIANFPEQAPGYAPLFPISASPAKIFLKFYCFAKSLFKIWNFGVANTKILPCRLQKSPKIGIFAVY